MRNKKFCIFIDFLYITPMPEIINSKPAFSLQEVCKSIKKTLENRYQTVFWVKAEMNKLHHYAQSGHCYPELVEKEDGVVKALVKANLWKDDYSRINQNFLSVLKEPLKDGIKILFSAGIVFDPVHGLALRIYDIDPSYTLGDLEKEKQLTIAKLKEEYLFNRNKLLPFPLLPQRIAIISVQTSKGYADFMQVLGSNIWGYAFFTYLFPSLLQGEKAIESIIQQLKRVEKVKRHFDIVVIIRGGGGDVGLSCYNHYLLAKTVAQFPLPVLTGIGHATNETVCEMIAFHNAITPTKLAEYFIQKFHNFSVPVKEAEQKIYFNALQFLNHTKINFEALLKLLKTVCVNRVADSKNILKNNINLLNLKSLFFLKNENKNMVQLKKDMLNNKHRFFKQAKSNIDTLENNIKLLHPDNILKRGFSISLLNGKALKDSSGLKKGEHIQTILYNGEIISTVLSKHKRNE